MIKTRRERLGIVLSAFLLIMTVSSCNDPKGTSTEKLEIETVSLKGEVLNIDSLNFPTRVVTSSERGFLFLVNIGQPGSNLINVHDLETGDFKKSFLARGNGPNELLSVGRVQIIEDKWVSVTGMLKKQLFLYNIDDIIDENEPLPFKVTQLDTKTRNPVMIGAEALIDIRENFKGDSILAKLNYLDPSGKRLNSFGEFPEAYMDQEPYHLNETFRFFMDIRDEKIFLVHAYTDLIEIFDLSGNLLVSKRGPDFFEPVTMPQKVGQGYMVVPTIETKMAFTFVNAGPSEAFALYSGRLMTEAVEHINQLIVFDHSAEFKRMYDLDIPIVHFDVDWGKRIIYGLSHEINDGESEIAVVKYEF